VGRLLRRNRAPGLYPGRDRIGIVWRKHGFAGDNLLIIIEITNKGHGLLLDYFNDMFINLNL
jgi:hypothetical protein